MEGGTTVPSEAQQVKFRLSAEEVAAVSGALGDGESLAGFAKRVTLEAASPAVKADAVDRSVEARTVDPVERMSKERTELEAAIEGHRTQARPGVRIAMMCDHKDCLPPYRRFFDSEEQAAEWKCPDHGRAVRQENKPYFGVSTV
jgi:hypothetical protein